MHSIEKIIKVNNQNIFGYSQSEALVCMERCPNNTFPIYWLPKKHLMQDNSEQIFKLLQIIRVNGNIYFYCIMVIVLLANKDFR